MPSPAIHVTDSLTDTQREQVRDLLARSTAADGVSALSEQSVLHLTSGPGRVRHLLSYAAERLTGYAQLEGTDDPAASGELLVDPDARRAGVGTALAQAALAQAPRARLWSHGRLPGALALADRLGLVAVRELHKMARPLGEADLDPAASALPAGFTARAFEPGRDEQAWLATNAAAFAHHPEQGSLTLEDLQERMALPWFDPAGFILVVADEQPDEVAAFHWTKVDPEETSSIDPTRPAGEVYVVGVHPTYQGRGLGRPVTSLGLAHLASLGLPEVVLYVDGDNRAAIRTYTGLGFRSIMVDVMYSHTVHQPLSG
ncbi:mycothiol synthase [Pedococcus sp. KACC 23699]|uniref:Mycothiol acetyltransferase n=1 Tax=Pedococcus sp. KACC 23699 TaxID=3149228 RepID=A0AAU7JXQ7_9MICO